MSLVKAMLKSYLTVFRWQHSTFSSDAFSQRNSIFPSAELDTGLCN